MRRHYILKVFRRDLKSIVTNPVALIIIVGLCLLPSLYAWINIAACWNVYENTGTIPVAVVNQDKAVEFNDKEVNIGRDVVDELKKNKSIKWIFVNEKQANLGLIDGTYFAMIQIPQNFSSNFTSVISEHPQKPYIIYKVDTKINPVAVKITDSAKNTLVQQIKTNFVSTVNETLFSSLNNLGNDADENKENILKLKDAIINLNRNMDLVQTGLESIKTNSDNLQSFLGDSNALMPAIQNSLGAIQNSNFNKQAMLVTSKEVMNNALDSISLNIAYTQASNDRINRLFKNLNEAVAEGNETKVNTLVPAINVELEGVNDAITATVNYLEKVNNEDSASRDRQVDNTISNLLILQGNLKTTKTQLLQLQSDLRTFSGSVSKLQETLKNSADTINTSISAMNNAIDTSVAQLEAINEMANSDTITQLIADLKALKSSNLATSLNQAVANAQKVTADVQALCATLDNDITKGVNLIDKTDKRIETTLKFLETFRKTVSNRRAHVKNIIQSLKDIQPYIKDEKNQFSLIQKSLIESNKINKNVADAINNDIYKIATQLTAAKKQYNTGAKQDLNAISDNLLVASKDAGKMIQSAKDLNQKIRDSMTLAQEGSRLASDFSGNMGDKLKDYKGTVSAMGQKFEMVDNSEFSLMISILQSNPEFMGDFMSNPFEMRTESIYSIPNYGSSMAPIYTTLALWVGCLLLNSLLKSNVGYFEGIELLTVRERFFGKMLTFIMIAAIQGFIVSVGDILVMGVYMSDAPLFVIFSVVSSVIFVIITYTLMCTMGNMGKALAIIYMILQLAGSGGTYPIQVDPLIFRILQPLFPFTYTVGGLREAIAGPLAISVIKDFVALFLFGVVFIIFGYFNIGRLEPWVRKFEHKMKASGIGE